MLIHSASGHAQAFRGDDTPAGIELPPLGTARGGRWDLAFGHRRLAILDLSCAGHQPMVDPSGRFWIIYNGEVYNYCELRNQLEELGHSFRSDTDTEVVLASLLEWGPECVTQFNGMWSFAVADLEQRLLLCSRDRFGIKPFHFTESGSTFTFASEIKALAGQEGFPLEPDEGAVARFIGLGQYPSARAGDTFYSNVHSIPPAHTMTVTATDSQDSRYYRIPDRPKEPARAPTSDLVKEFRNLLLESVRLRLRSDVAVGSCLSGGLDSSSIVAAIHHLRQNDGAETSPQLTFSSVFHEKARYNERPFVDLMLERFPVQGILVFPSDDDVLNHLHSVVTCQDEPFGDFSIMAQWCVMRAAREHGVGVLLDGQGADELLGGYTPFVPHIADRLTNMQFRRAAHEIRSLPRGTRVRSAASAAAQLLPTALHRYLTRRFKPRLPGIDLLSPSQLAYIGPSQLSVPRTHRTDLSALLREQIEETVLPNLLRYEDRNSSAFGIEARVPFLDHRLVDFVFTKAWDLRIKDGWTKWMLRAAFADDLPNRITWRREKVGFGAPGHRWLGVARSMAGFVQEAPRQEWSSAIQLAASSHNHKSSVERIVAVSMWGHWACQ